MDDELKTIKKAAKWGTFVSLLLVILCLAGCPYYNVFQQEMSGRAMLAEAQSSRQTKVLEARATMESAQLLAQAEVRRATGAAEANHILQGSLGGPAGRRVISAISKSRRITSWRVTIAPRSSMSRPRAVCPSPRLRA